MLTDDSEEVLAHAEVCVGGSREARWSLRSTGSRPEQNLVDLVRLPDAAQRRSDARYTGIAW